MMKKERKNIRKIFVSSLIAVFVLSLLSGIVPLNDFNLVQPVSADWSKKASIHINNTGGSALSYYQVNLNITYDSDMNNNFSDLRVKNETAGAFVPYWVEDKLNGSWCNLWFNATSIPASGWYNDTYYLYYGDTGASSESNITTTFLFGDDFPGESEIDKGRWFDQKYTGNPVISPNDGTAGIDDIGTAWGYFMTNGTNDYRMYYTGIQEAGGRDYDICLATSTDGQTWTRITNGIGGTHKVIDDDSAWAGPVWRENSTYYMIYKKSDGGYKWYLVNSTDGISWNSSVLVRDDGSEISSLMKIGSTYHAWASDTSPSKVFHYTSTNLTTWTKQNGGSAVLEVAGKGVVCPDIFYNVNDSKYYIIAGVVEPSYQGVYRMWKADDTDFQTNLEVIGDILIFSTATIPFLDDWEKSGWIDGQHFMWSDVFKQISNTDKLYFYYSAEATASTATYDISQGLVEFTTVGAAITAASEEPLLSGLDTDKWGTIGGITTTLSNGTINITGGGGQSDAGIYSKIYNHSSAGVFVEWKGKISVETAGMRSVGSRGNLTQYSFYYGSGGLDYSISGVNKLNVFNYQGVSSESEQTITINEWYRMRTELQPSKIKIVRVNDAASVEITNTLASHQITVCAPHGFCLDFVCVRKYTSPEPTASLGTQSGGGAYNITLLSGYNIVGWTDTTTRNANYVATDIGSNCTYVVEKNRTTGTYNSFDPNVPEIENFAVERGWGYFIYVSTETLWERDA